MEPEQLIARVQELTGRLEDLDDPACRNLAEELTAAVVQMYGAGLERIVELIEDDETRDRLAGDELVAGLLMIHDLYPVPLEERVVQALDTVRPYMESHGGNVEFLGIEDGVAKLRLAGSCKSCRASSSTLELAVRQALQDAAPDLLGMDVEGIVEEEAEESTVTGVPLPVLQMNGTPSWHTLDIGAPAGMVATSVGELSLFVANVDGTLLAYRNACASCGGDLAEGALDAGALACPACGRRYFLPQAGRSMDDEHLQLQPIPLLREADEIRVAL
jgi:Fe-S cluster biogenesis protein NfuA/nitrite reductase/ring-hydroxylating ferredoxin subunit/phenylpyruvate tautomerase PptA (4-oxalocrotonate tautomerase family)